MKIILIVEAVEAHRQSLVYWLKDDYTVCTVADGAAGVALAEQIDPDLIFMALGLPGMDGGEAIRQIKARARLRDTPIIALTAQTVPDEGIAARAAGCVDALRTPLEAEPVYAILRKWLGGG